MSDEDQDLRKMEDINNAPLPNTTHTRVWVMLPVIIQCNSLSAGRGCVLLFVFQAEDGIRVLYVTGVQRVLFRSPSIPPCEGRTERRRTRRSPPSAPRAPRSEERRVGKESRSRWSPNH